MAYGNLPGGGYSGFMKSKSPLWIEERSYVPVKDEQLKYGVYGEKYGVYGDKIDDGKKDEAATHKSDKESAKLGRTEAKERRKMRSLRRKVSFDDDNLEQHPDIVAADRYRSDEPVIKAGEDEHATDYPRVAPKEKKYDSATDRIGSAAPREDDSRDFRKKKIDQSTSEKPPDDGFKVASKKKTRQEKTPGSESFSEHDVRTMHKRKMKTGRELAVTGPKNERLKIMKKRHDDKVPEDHLKTGPPRIEESQRQDWPIDGNEKEGVTKGVGVEKTEDFQKQDEIKFDWPEEEGSRLESVSDDERNVYVKFKRAKRVSTYTYCKRKRSLLRFCPCLNRLLYSKREEYRGLKAMLGFPIGALFGFALYWIVLERIGADQNYFWVLGIFGGIGYAVSTQVRCICWLSIPACFGRVGRAFVSTYVVAYLIQGPFTNILINSKEAMRSISCTASLNLNHSMERFRLMFKPIKEIVFDFVGAGDKVQKDTKQLEKTFKDVENEVRDENEVRESMADVEELDDEIGVESRADIIKKKFKKRRRPEFGEDSEKKYGMKSELRCEGVFTKGVRGCYHSFGKAYDRCHSYLPIIGYLLCWPMKLTFICDLASSMMGKRACDSDDVMNPGFGASVDTADGVQSEFDKDFSVQLQYKIKIPEERYDQLVPEDIAGAMRYSFERRKKNLDFFTQVVDRILALLFLIVINSSRKYCNQYLRSIQFDNKYVTSYFRHIDARRRKAGKTVLLPLKKGEKLELFNPFSVRFSADEKIVLIVNGLRLISEILTVSILLLFDRIFYELLDVIKRNSHVTYKQSGVHHIKMTIYGDGFVGNMVRGILKGFDKKHSADQVTTTEECLPLPTKLPGEMVTRLYFVFFLMFLLIIMESYALRLRRVICAFFYPKIDSGVFFSLRRFYPKYFSWLSKLGLVRSQCLICTETESRKCPLVACPNCPFSYCLECWQDTEGSCYACLPDYDTEPSENSSTDD